MKITLTDAGKRFNRDWIFRNLSATFLPGKSYAITGPNGSGKSTLLQAIAGSLMLSEGKIEYTDSADQRPVANDHAFQHLSIAAPYLELVEEMTATEFLRFHQHFKKFLTGFTIPDILTKVGLSAAAHKQIRYYSSGMKQRMKIAQAIFSDVPVIMLDEPCTNLDAEGIGVYRTLIDAYTQSRMVFVSSNDIQEYDFCTERINILEFKAVSTQ